MVRRGRLSDEERYLILERIGEEAENRYRQNLLRTGYKGDKFRNAFLFAPDVDAFDNEYTLDTGNSKLNQILQWLEYGTGLYGSLKHMIQSKRVSTKTGKQLLLKFKAEGDWIYKRQVKGIKPGFMFTKAVQSVRNEHNTLMQRYRSEMGF